MAAFQRLLQRSLCSSVGLKGLIGLAFQGINITSTCGGCVELIYLSDVSRKPGIGQRDSCLRRGSFCLDGNQLAARLRTPLDLLHKYAWNQFSRRELAL